MLNRKSFVRQNDEERAKKSEVFARELKPYVDASPYWELNYNPELQMLGFSRYSENKTFLNHSFGVDVIDREELEEFFDTPEWKTCRTLYTVIQEYLTQTA
jgi:hypothetical protein